MLATYAAALAVVVASLVLGQGVLALCGARRWSWIAPPAGLSLLCAICWATVRMPGDGVVPAIVALVLMVGGAVYLRRRLEGGGDALRAGWPVALGALIAASFPFAVEGHFGILGTGFNPDMSQHLLATDRLAHGAGSQLLHQGYPLGPHSIVVALNKGIGIGIVQGFDGLTIAAAVLAPLTALAAFADQPSSGGSGAPFAAIASKRRTGTIAALLVGLPYLVASYYAQGAFKEVIQALLVLAFVLALRESTRSWRGMTLRFVPAALLAIGSVYTYSFPGLIWLASIAAIWAIAEWAWGISASPAGGGAGGTAPEEALATGRGGGSPAPTGPAGWRPLSLAVLVFAIGSLPELGRMIDFHSFETFDPNGPGLGNLFGQISPFTALGIWPSGDFRLAPGDGAVPAFAYYLGAVFAAVLFGFGLRRAWRDRAWPLLAGLASVAGLYAAARVAGTPYTSAKALEIAAPLLTLAILAPSRGGVDVFPSPAGGAGGGSVQARRRVFRPRDSTSVAASPGEKPSAWTGHPSAPGPAGRRAPSLTPPHPLLWFYLLAAGVCALLALANAPVGPTSYSPALTGLRPLLAGDSTLFLAPDSLLADEHGERYVVWELRGGHICVEPASDAGGKPPVGIRFFITTNPAPQPFDGLTVRRRAGPYIVWERHGVLGGPSPCPLIAVRQARAGG